jgi:short-subunit dehydrogenase
VDKLNATSESFESVRKGSCFVVPCDVPRIDDIDRAVETIRTHTRRLDVLVNNAGVSQRSFALDTSREVERELFEVNYFGAVAIAKAVVPWMISQGGGHVAVVSSMAGKYGFRMRSAYSASKHALHGYFETLRAEIWPNRIHIVLIVPGRIRTKISLNAVTANGTPHGKLDRGQLKGISAERCAARIVRAISNKRKEVFIGRMELVLLVIKRLFPPLYYYIVNRASPT